MNDSWKLVESIDVSDHRVFRLRHDVYHFGPAGTTRDFVVLDSPDWINVVPVTDDGRIIMIRQYRHGTRTVMLEVPGGMIDPGESPEEAAERELLEETGYEAERIELLGRVRPNPAILDNTCHMFLAEGCRRVAELNLDAFEQIEVMPVAIEEIPEMVRTGHIDHGLVLNALGYMGLTKVREANRDH